MFAWLSSLLRRGLPCVVAAVLPLGVAACGTTPKAAPLTWDIVFATPLLASAKAHVEVRIVPGGCDDDTAAPLSTADLTEEAGDGGATADAPPPLKKGTYGFQATAWDAGCRPYAAGCTEVSVPKKRPTTVTVKLKATNARRACEEEFCSAGYCGDGDAGADAGDGAAGDASAP